MNEFTTVFEITAGSNGLRGEVLFDVAIGVLAVTFGVVSVVRARRREARLLEMVVPAFFFVWGVSWLAAQTPLWHIGISETSRLVELQRSGRSEVTEGVIHVGHQQPAHGHSSGDKLTLGGRQFEVNYFLATPGYRQTIAHGGALREGVYARLHHDGGVILKVEVKQPPP
jgi:hypothetical protein